MERELQLRLLRELFDQIERGPSAPTGPDAVIPVEPYVSETWLAAERRVLFRELPLVVGHASEIAAPGSFLTHDDSGVPLLIVRTGDGTARAFLNVCRHRGSKLVTEASGQARSFVCRYHAWSYELGGRLQRVPRRELFPTLCDEDVGLVPVPLAERHGLLWAVPGGRGTALDIDSYLGAIGPELAAFSLDTHHVHRRVSASRQANWKLVIDAFLEGYHVRSLHRDTISRFFLDAIVTSSFPPHSRSLGGRKTLLAARGTPPETWDLRELTTPFYFLFPNTVLVFHPDWISLMTVYPDSVGSLRYCHRMLIPQLPASAEDSEHWDKTFQLIDANVFQREDLAIAESIQAGFAAGANSEFRIGHMETAIKWFHDEIAARLRGAAAH